MVYKVDIGLICWQMIVIWMAQYFIQAGWSLMHLRALHWWLRMLLMQQWFIHHERNDTLLYLVWINTSSSQAIGN